MTWFKQLEPRERLVLITGGFILAGALFYALLWKPLLTSQAELKNLVTAEQKNLQWMYGAAREVQQLRTQTSLGKKPTDQNSSLLSLIDNSATILGAINKRIEPQGTDTVVMSIEQVSFTELMRWLSQLYNQHQIQVVNIVIERLKTNDSVKVKVGLRALAPS